MQMKIFSWMQSKLNAMQGTKNTNAVPANHHTLQEPCREEFSDWPHGLLAIGTFGNTNVKEDPEKCNLQRTQASCQQDISLEEVGELQKEMKPIFDKKVSAEPSSEDELGTHNLQLEKFFNCPPSLEVDRATGETICANKGSSLQCNSTGVFFSKGKDICLDNTNNSISKKSLSFLLKNTFLCRSGFNPTPSFRDSLPESRMEKIFKAILHKKIYPQSSIPKAIPKKYLENKHMPMTDTEDGMLEKTNDGSKWVKTDSEFIVLEI